MRVSNLINDNGTSTKTKGGWPKVSSAIFLYFLILLFDFLCPSSLLCHHFQQQGWGFWRQKARSFLWLCFLAFSLAPSLPFLSVYKRRTVKGKQPNREWAAEVEWPREERGCPLERRKATGVWQNTFDCCAFLHHVHFLPVSVIGCKTTVVRDRDRWTLLWRYLWADGLEGPMKM